MIRLGATMDDAIGEAFDKTAKLLGLAYPGGPAVEEAARTGDPERFALPRPMMGRPNADFSLSGLKTAVRHAAESAAPLTRAGRRRPLRLVPGGGRRCDRGPACGSALEALSRAARRRAAGAGASRAASPPIVRSARARALLRRGGPADGRAAAEAVHRQRRDDRLGGRRAAAARPHRRARRAARPRWPLDPKVEPALNNKA